MNVSITEKSIVAAKAAKEKFAQGSLIQTKCTLQVFIPSQAQGKFKFDFVIFLQGVEKSFIILFAEFQKTIHKKIFRNFCMSLQTKTLIC